jgi:hypothetical protein
VSLYEAVEELDDRTRSRLENVLMADEEFIVGARAADGLLSRWCSRIIVTTRRVISIRHVGLDWSVDGHRRERIHDVSGPSGPENRVMFTDGLTAVEYTFEDAVAAKRIAEELP